jgi:uncharacterized damage-inducible protein DinB
MTYYGGKEMAASFRTVRGNTIRVAEDIPEEQYDFRAAPGTRSVRQMLSHIAGLHVLQHRVQSAGTTDLGTFNFGVLVGEMLAEEAKPRTKAEILSLLKSNGDQFAAYLESLSESFLAEPVAMPPGAQPPSKSRLEMLLSVKEHEMHHRAQLMTMQRMIGVVPHLTTQMMERMAAQSQAAAR